MTTHSWMAGLAEQLGIDAITFDAEGRAGVHHPDGVTVEIHADSDHRLVHLCSFVAQVPVLDAVACMKQLLRQPVLRGGTYVPAFAIERESRSIALTLSLPEDGIEAAALADALHVMVERTKAARTALSRDPT